MKNFVRDNKQVITFTKNLLTIFTHLPSGKTINSAQYQDIKNSYNIDLNYSNWFTLPHKLTPHPALGIFTNNEGYTPRYIITYLNNLNIERVGFLISDQSGSVILSPTNLENTKVLNLFHPCIYFYQDEHQIPHYNPETEYIETKDSYVLYNRLNSFYKHKVYKDTLNLEPYKE